MKYTFFGTLISYSTLLPSGVLSKILRIVGEASCCSLILHHRSCLLVPGQLERLVDSKAFFFFCDPKQRPDLKAKLSGP